MLRNERDFDPGYNEAGSFTAIIARARDIAYREREPDLSYAGLCETRQ
jgi:hypothetical protein